MDTAEQTANEPVTRQEADDAYRRMRGFMLFSLLWFLGVAAVIAVLGVSGWPIYLAGVIVIEGISIPLFLRYYRRELDRRVRASEATLGKE
jgi:membrane protein implicated in regulation of membrane protease activity